jgi:signal transduction histidine kinase
MMDDRELLQQELKTTRLAYYRATEMSKFKAGFLARTAHELRSPLASIISLHQLILTDLCENPQEEREFLQQAYQAALKLTQLLDRTVFISKLEDASIEIEQKSFLLIDLLTEIEQTISLQAANRGIRLTFKQFDGDNCYIVGDYTCLSQTITLLLESAILQAKSEEICLSATAIPDTTAISIDIELTSNSDIWLESSDLLQQIPDVSNLSAQSHQQTSQQVHDFSAGMKFLLAQQLLEKMAGNLELTEISSLNSPFLTRLSFSLPQEKKGF